MKELHVGDPEDIYGQDIIGYSEAETDEDKIACLEDHIIFLENQSLEAIGDIEEKTKELQ